MRGNDEDADCSYGSAHPKINVQSLSKPTFHAFQTSALAVF